MILEFKNVTGKTKHFNLQDVSFALEPGYDQGRIDGYEECKQNFNKIQEFKQNKLK